MLLPHPWVVRLEPPLPARARLVCLPFAGGGSAMFYSWRELLPETELLLVQLPGRGARLFEAPFTRLDPLVQEVGQALELEPAGLPCFLFAHSMGALIAFELARRFCGGRGPHPSRLFVSACRAPHLPDGNAPLHRLPDDRLMRELRRFNGTPPDVLANGELMSLVLPTLRADLAVFETYRHVLAPPLPLPITAIGGREDARVSLEELAAWQQHTSADFDLLLLPGGHFYIQSSRDLLLGALAARLPGARAGAGPHENKTAPAPWGPGTAAQL